MGTIAWIGLGLTGRPKSNQMRNAGHVVRGFDIDKEACRQASAFGIMISNSIAEACADADAVFAMLPAGPDVKQVLTARDGNVRKGAVVVDCSAIGVAYTSSTVEQEIDLGRRANVIVNRGQAFGVKRIWISERHSHLVFGLIQSAITCAVGAGIASVPLMETGSFAVHWAKAWAISWVSMLPVVILATPFIRAFVDRLVRHGKPSQRLQSG
jgi:6-phosphogluconate dehydrogenase (decarboxylating)